jgi:hypothetical protein
MRDRRQAPHASSCIAASEKPTISTSAITAIALLGSFLVWASIAAVTAKPMHTSPSTTDAMEAPYLQTTATANAHAVSSTSGYIADMRDLQ